MNKNTKTLSEAARSVSSAIFMAVLPWKANEIEFNSVFPKKQYKNIARK